MTVIGCFQPATVNTQNGESMNPLSKRILVMGGGMSGITTTLEAAEVGYEVLLVEKESYLGGRVSRLNEYFPKMCPPYCGLEINFKRIRQNQNIKYFTLAQIEKVAGKPGNYEVSVNQNPRFVNENCTMCGKCSEVCPVERSDDFNYGFGKTKAIYLPHEMAFPPRFVIDGAVCKGASCGKCFEVCKYNAINLEEKPRSFKIEVGSIVLATGFSPYDAAKMDNLGYGKFPNVITNVQMERLAAPNGPTGGKLLRPSDGKQVTSVAFAQCAGSRDENHLAYCSGICCLASLKQSAYVRALAPEADVTIFYIDLRARGRYESVLTKVKEDAKTKLQKGKVAKIEAEANGDLMVTAEDTLTGNKSTAKFDMVVLATGMVPSPISANIISDLKYDQYGFAMSDFDSGGIFAAGCAKKPADVATSVQDATATALKAIQTIVKGGPVNG